MKIAQQFYDVLIDFLSKESDLHFYFRKNFIIDIQYSLSQTLQVILLPRKNPTYLLNLREVPETTIFNLDKKYRRHAPHIPLKDIETIAIILDMILELEVDSELFVKARVWKITHKSKTKAIIFNGGKLESEPGKIICNLDNPVQIDSFKTYFKNF